MSVFSDINLNWSGREYIIRAHRVMGVLGRIEKHITLPELQEYAERGTMPFARMASAYGEALRYAGASVKNEEIYAVILEEAETQAGVISSIMQLMQMMLPADARAKIEARLASGVDDTGDEVEGQSGNLSAAGKAASSKRHSSSRVGRSKKAARG